MKSKTKIKCTYGSLQRPDGTTSTSDDERANILNTFFTEFESMKSESLLWHHSVLNVVCQSKD